MTAKTNELDEATRGRVGATFEAEYSGPEDGNWARLHARSADNTGSGFEMALNLLPTHIRPGDRLRFVVTATKAPDEAERDAPVMLHAFLVIYTFAGPHGRGHGNRLVATPFGGGLHELVDVRAVEQQIADDIEADAVTLIDWKQLRDVPEAEVRRQGWATYQRAGVSR